MNKSVIKKGRQILINVGCASLKEKLNGLKLRLMILFTILIFASGCTEFALLMSGSSIAISQNAYVKAYNGLDVLTIMNTEKGIKSHIYTSVRELYEHSKFREE
jgi:hypothetical protein